AEATFAEQRGGGAAAALDRLCEGPVIAQSLRRGWHRATRELAGEAELEQTFRANAAGVRRSQRRTAFETLGRRRHNRVDWVHPCKREAVGKVTGGFWSF